MVTCVLLVRSSTKPQFKLEFKSRRKHGHEALMDEQRTSKAQGAGSSPVMLVRQIGSAATAPRSRRGGQRLFIGSSPISGMRLWLSGNGERLRTSWEKSLRKFESSKSHMIGKHNRKCAGFMPRWLEVRVPSRKAIRWERNRCGKAARMQRVTTSLRAGVRFIWMTRGFMSLRIARATGVREAVRPTIQTWCRASGCVRLDARIAGTLGRVDARSIPLFERLRLSAVDRKAQGRHLPRGRRCGSTVERSLRKRVVEGSNPFVGFATVVRGKMSGVREPVGKVRLPVGGRNGSQGQKNNRLVLVTHW
jgi:hypothetical protein